MNSTALNSNTTKSIPLNEPSEIIEIGGSQADRSTREIERVGASSAQRIRPTVNSIDELEDSYDGDEVVLKTADGSSLMRFIGGRWIENHPSLDGMKIETGNDGIPNLIKTVNGKRYKLPFVLDTSPVVQRPNNPVNGNPNDADQFGG